LRVVQSRSILQEREDITSQSQVTAAPQRATAPIGKRFISDLEVESLYGIPRETLQNWRVLGRCPRFRKFGSGVRYGISDLESWVNSLPSGVSQENSIVLLLSKKKGAIIPVGNLKVRSV
jgi:hypothetical protein